MPSPSDAAELKALFEGVAAAQREAELTWGAERLPILVGPEWRIKLRRQQARFSAALQAAWDADSVSADQIEAVRKSAETMVKAWVKLAAVAAEAGHRPQPPGVLAERVLRDGSVAVIVRDNDSAAQVNAEGRAVVVYTLEEVFNLIGELVPDSLALAKIHFPGARFQGPKLDDAPEWSIADGEAIPFGAAA